jgi:hypothetical protein
MTPDVSTERSTRAANHVDRRLLETHDIAFRDARCVTAMRRHRHIQRQDFSDRQVDLL